MTPYTRCDHKGYREKLKNGSSMPTKPKPKSYEYEGQSKTISKWAEEYGINRATLAKRLERGIDMKTALSTKGYLSVNKTKAQKAQESQ